MKKTLIKTDPIQAFSILKDWKNQDEILIVEGISDEDYHRNSPGISRSGLSTILRSVDEYHWEKQNPKEPTPAMILGSMVHAYMLQPWLKNTYTVSPKINRRTKEGKIAYEQFQFESIGKIIVDTETYAECLSMVGALDRDDIVNAFINHKSTLKEVAFFWWDQETGIQRKCKIDAFNPVLGWCVDIKTTRDASPGGFSREILNHKYHLQGADYLSALKLAGYDIKQFVIFAVENEPPHLVAKYAIDEGSLDAGATLVRMALNKYWRDVDTGDTGYSKDVLSIGIPHYGFNIEEV